MNQLPLFDDERVRHLHRATDPDTSREAAEQVVSKIGKRQQEALHWIRRFPHRTAAEIDQLAGYQHRELSKRFGELKAKGLIVVAGTRICSLRGTRCETYKVKQ